MVLPLLVFPPRQEMEAAMGVAHVTLDAVVGGEPGQDIVGRLRGQGAVGRNVHLELNGAVDPVGELAVQHMEGQARGGWAAARAGFVAGGGADIELLEPGPSAGDTGGGGALGAGLFGTADQATGWQMVNDDVMGGVSTSQFQVLNSGAAIFSGLVSLENNGGFASVRSLPMRHDLTGCDAFLLRVCGDGCRYKFTVRIETRFDTPLYQCTFGTKRGEWEEHRLPFTSFVPTFRGRVLADVPPINPANVCSVGLLIADQQAGAFRLEVGWIKALRRMA